MANRRLEAYEAHEAVSAGPVGQRQRSPMQSRTEAVNETSCRESQRSYLGRPVTVLPSGSNPDTTRNREGQIQVTGVSRGHSTDAALVGKGQTSEGYD
jgi:hypothetical protein